MPHASGASTRHKTPHRWGRVSPRLALRTVLVLLALGLLVLVVTGCGNPELPAAATATSTPQPSRPAPPTTTTAAPTTTSTPSSTPTTDSPAPTTGSDAAPSTGPTPGGGHPSTRSPGPGAPGAGPRAGAVTGGKGTPIWPATDAAQAATLQKKVDGGGEPWLLDPTEVATSYAGVALHYRNPSVFTLRPGVIDVQDGAGPGKATLTLAQTVRRGDGGIWLITEARRR